jgi:branched-chain amino acid transport system substrate-binding protein
LKRIIFLIIASLLVLGIVLPGCGGTTTPAGPVTYDFTGGVIKIAIAGPMDYIQGTNMYAGALLAKNTMGTVNISGVAHTVQLISVNTKEIAPPWGTYPAEQVENAITVQGANFVMGGFRTEATAGMVNKAMDLKKMFFVAGSATGDILKQVNNNYNKYKYLFRATPINESFLFLNTMAMMGMVGETIKGTLMTISGGGNASLGNATLSQPRVAFFAEDLLWTAVPLASVAAALVGLNYTYLGTWKVSDTATTVATELNQIAALCPHIIFTFLSGPVGLTYGKEMGSLNISAMSVGINVEGQDPGFWAATKVSGENWWGANGMLSLMTWAPNVNQTVLTQPFLTAFKAANGGQMPIYTAATYDMVLTLKKAIEATATYNATASLGSVLAADLIAWFENATNAQLGTAGTSGYYSTALGGYVTAGVPCFAHDLKWGVNVVSNVSWQTGLGVQWANNGTGGGLTVGVWPKAEYSAIAQALFATLNAPLVLNWTGFEWPGTVTFTTPSWMIPLWLAYTCA